jgi:hypothetical protein
MTNAALLACLLSGWPAAEDCHKKLVEKGPKAVAEVKKGLLEALADDPGLAPREHNNRVALTSSAGRRGKGHPDSARLKKAVSAAEELGRLGEWRHLRRLGTVTAAEGLGKMEDPPVEALRTLTAWASEPKQRRRQLAAAYSLKWYGPKAQPVVPELIVMLRDPGRARARQAAQGQGLVERRVFDAAQDQDARGRAAHRRESALDRGAVTDG